MPTAASSPVSFGPSRTYCPPGSPRATWKKRRQKRLRCDRAADGYDRRNGTAGAYSDDLLTLDRRLTRQAARSGQVRIERILVYGVTGSGKTTVARQIGERTGLPWHSVDDLTWEPGWVPVPDEEQRRRIAAICAGERWVLDTAYGNWLDLPLERAQLVVGLDYPRWLSLQRLIRRTVVRAIDRRPVCNGNVESFRSAFSRDWIVFW